MVKYDNNNLDMVLNALSHEIRRKIIERLLKGTLTVTELAQPFTVSLPAITKHLNILEEAQLISRKKDGRKYIVSLNTKPLLELKKWFILYELHWIRLLSTLNTP